MGVYQSSQTIGINGTENKMNAELNQQVAMKVMGSHIITVSQDNTAIWHGSKVGMGTYMIRDDQEPHEWGPQVEDIPNYSGDISAAWQVVEEMSGKGYLFTIQEMDNKDWYAAFDAYGSYSYPASKAICLAALAAIEEEKELDKGER
jgi:hypothetical protein